MNNYSNSPFKNRSDGAMAICRKWYEKLGFMPEYDREFYEALENNKISDTINIDSFDVSSTDGKRNLLSYLFMCETLEKKYKDKGIEEDVLIDTLRDIPIWTNIWSELKGQLYLGELSWLKHHLSMKLFRLGSLEFYMGKSSIDCDVMGLNKGDDILDVHIPHNASLRKEDCINSFEKAKAFFAKHYHEIKFRHFVCHSWLLDDELDKLLKPNSNIIGFKNMFYRIKGENDESYAALRYVFDWNTSKNDLENKHPSTSLAANMQRHVLSGGKLYQRFGIIKMNENELN